MRGLPAASSCEHRPRAVPQIVVAMGRQRLRICRFHGLGGFDDLALPLRVAGFTGAIAPRVAQVAAACAVGDTRSCLFIQLQIGRLAVRDRQTEGRPFPAAVGQTIAVAAQVDQLMVDLVLRAVGGEQRDMRAVGRVELKIPAGVRRRSAAELEYPEAVPAGAVCRSRRRIRSSTVRKALRCRLRSWRTARRSRAAGRWR